MINIRNNKSILFIFLLIVIIIQAFIVLKTYEIVNIYFFNDLINIIMTLPIVLWGYSLYYRITDIKIRNYSLIFAFLLYLWMLIKFTKLYCNSMVLNEFLWYLYYVPFLLSIYIYFRIILLTTGKDKNRVISKVFFIITVLLIILVLTNSFHHLVFSFKTVYIPKKHKYELGYWLVLSWLIVLGLYSLFNIFNFYRNRKKNQLLLLVSVFVLMLLYNTGYIVRVPGIFKSDFSLFTTIFMIYIFEVSIRMNVIPGNFYYDSIFNVTFSNMVIVDKNLKIKYLDKNLDKVPHTLFEKIDKSKNKQEIILKGYENTIFYVNKINGGYSIYFKDITTINNLLKEIKNKSALINRQNNILHVEKRIRNTVVSKKINDDLKNRLDNALVLKMETIGDLCDLIYGYEITKKQDYYLLSIVKILTGYTKNKASLVLKSANRSYLTVEEVSILLHNMMQDTFTSGIVGEVFVDIHNDMPVEIVGVVFDFLLFVIEKCLRFYAVNIFIRLTEDDSSYYMHLIIDSKSKLFLEFFKLQPVLEELMIELNVSCSLELEDNSILYNLHVYKAGKKV